MAKESGARSARKSTRGFRDRKRSEDKSEDVKSKVSGEATQESEDVAPIKRGKKKDRKLTQRAELPPEAPTDPALRRDRAAFARAFDPYKNDSPRGPEGAIEAALRKKDAETTPKAWKGGGDWVYKIDPTTAPGQIIVSGGTGDDALGERQVTVDLDSDMGRAIMEEYARGDAREIPMEAFDAPQPAPMDSAPAAEAPAAPAPAEEEPNYGTSDALPDLRVSATAEPQAPEPDVGESQQPLGELYPDEYNKRGEKRFDPNKFRDRVTDMLPSMAGAKPLAAAGLGDQPGPAMAEPEASPAPEATPGADAAPTQGSRDFMSAYSQALQEGAQGEGALAMTLLRDNDFINYINGRPDGVQIIQGLSQAIKSATPQEPNLGTSGQPTPAPAPAPEPAPAPAPQAADFTVGGQSPTPPVADTMATNASFKAKEVAAALTPEERKELLKALAEM